MDVTKFLAHSRRVDVDDLDLALARSVGLSPDERAILTYFADIEDQTPFYMRELLNTPARRDPDLVGFLTMWAYEEYFHARALQGLLSACGCRQGTERAAEVRGRARFRARAEELIQTAIARLCPAAFTALYFTWGASQEYLTLSGYQELARRTDNPVLAQLCRRIAKQERRHFAWYYNSAREHLARSRWARVLTRFVIDRFWTPVGVGVKSAREVAEMTARLFPGGSHENLLDRVEYKIRALPGLERVEGISRYAGRMTAAMTAPLLPANSAIIQGT